MTPFHSCLARVALVLVGVFGASALHAEAPRCPQAEELRYPKPPPQPRPSRVGAPTYISAEEVESIAAGVTRFRGQVELVRVDTRVTAQDLEYDKAADTVVAHGGVRLAQESGESYETDHLQLSFDSHEGELGPSRFRFDRAPARGDAAVIRFEGEDLTRLREVRFTTCPVGQDDWFLKFSELELDRASEIGTARHASVSFFGVPIFYFPYLNFAYTDRRKSGFLFPQLGRSDELGTIVAAPYYLNLAPNYDATLTPRWLSRRGFQMQSEFRYLLNRGRGILDLESVPRDQVTDEARAAWKIEHNNIFGARWSASMNAERVSDADYLEDYGDELDLTSRTHLPQIFTLGYHGQVWQLALRTTKYQTIDPTIPAVDRPFARLPQLTANAATPAVPNRLRLELGSELVNFRRDESLEAVRLNLNPALSLPLKNRYGFLTPKLAAWYSEYDLSETSDDPPSTSVGVFSLDGGLVFERRLQRYTHTLEPRMFYLKIPRENQDTLPVFDAALPDLSFANLFRENRFVGGDRIGDADQLTLALSTRFFDDRDGTERFRASLGRIFYFEDRRVNLPAARDEENASDLVAEVGAMLRNNVYLQAAVQWDKDDGATERANYYLQYNPHKDRILSLGYRFLRDEVKQVDLAAEWPISARWTFRGRSIHSLIDDDNVETYLGAQYNACCWAFRAYARRRLLDSGEQSNDFMLELELIGLSRLGSSPRTPLRDSVFYPMR